MKYTFIFYIAVIINTMTLYVPCSADPSTIEFAWDLHGVLFWPNKRKIINTIGRYGLTTIRVSSQAAQQHISHRWGNPKGPILNLISHAQELSKQGATTELYIHDVALIDQELADFIRTAASHQKLNPEMVILVQELHNLGYVQRVASNIGTSFYADLQQVYPHFFSMFTAGKTVDYKQIYNDIIQKPNKKFFQEFIAKYNPYQKKKIIFIDDRMENILSARACGIEAIHFTNQADLRSQLRSLSIPLKPKVSFKDKRHVLLARR